MKRDKFFRMAVIVSAVAHAAIFSYKPHMITLPSKKSLEKFEITYYRVDYKPKKAVLIPKQEENIKPAEAKVQVAKKQKTEFYKTQSQEKIAVKPAPVKPQQEKKKAEKELSKKVALPQVAQNMPKGEAYLDYYEILRQKIKRYISYPNINASGEVYIVFTIASEGTLKDIAINKEKSSDNHILKDAAARGIKDASPFPPFPKGLTPQGTQSFNIIISFESRE